MTSPHSPNGLPAQHTELLKQEIGSPLFLTEVVTFSDLQDSISKLLSMRLFSSQEISAKRILQCLPQWYSDGK